MIDKMKKHRPHEAAVSRPQSPKEPTSKKKSPKAQKSRAPGPEAPSPGSSSSRSRIESRPQSALSHADNKVAADFFNKVVENVMTPTLAPTAERAEEKEEPVEQHVASEGSKQAETPVQG